MLAFEEEAGSVKDVEINEVDIDNFIRAKGAIFSAVRTMLASLDFDVSMIDDVYVAGGIGSGINMKMRCILVCFLISLWKNSIILETLLYPGHIRCCYQETQSENVMS